ncbi:hypothetical protein ACJA88_009557 [Fusarium oxysporum]
MLLFGNHVAKDWYHLVVRFMDYEATDPRDKIYALIGLADQTGYDIVADYSMPVLEVYRDFAVKMISVTKKLDILQYSTVQDLDAEKVPLWVPDFQKVAKEPIYFSEHKTHQKTPKPLWLLLMAMIHCPCKG